MYYTMVGTGVGGDGTSCCFSIMKVRRVGQTSALVVSGLSSLRLTARCEGGIICIKDRGVGRALSSYFC